MWMPKDVAFWLALIALILAIPFNLFASWLYPRLQNWWAARSRKSLQKRIDKLTASLAEMYEGRGMSVRDEWVLVCAEKLGKLIFWGVVAIVYTILLAMASFIRLAPHPYRILIIFASFMVIYKIIRDYLMARIEGYRRFAGPMAKTELEISIADLKAKLAARELPKAE